jgi:hypothetical protein
MTTVVFIKYLIMMVVIGILQKIQSGEEGKPSRDTKNGIIIVPNGMNDITVASSTLVRKPGIISQLLTLSGIMEPSLKDTTTRVSLKVSKTQLT